MQSSSRQDLGPSWEYMVWLAIRNPLPWLGTFMAIWGFVPAVRNWIVSIIADRPGPVLHALKIWHRFHQSYHLDWVGLGMCILATTYIILRWVTTRYWIDEGSLFVQTGILTREINTVGGSLIYDANTSQSLPQLIAGAGNIEVLTADHQRTVLQWVPKVDAALKSIISVSSINSARVLGSV